MSGLESRFDWYSATFEDLDDQRVPVALAVALDASITMGRGKLGYSRCATIERDDVSLARVFGGSARRGEVHVAVSGDACDRLVPLIRRLWPEHRVARADSAMDFSADFAEIDGRALDFARARRLSFRLITDSEGGATRYLGAPSSEVSVRVYKKTEQLRSMHPERASEVPDGIVRAEMQARPGTIAKSLVATMTADALWGLGGWTRDFAATFLDIEAERVRTHFDRPSDWSRALHWMGQQYGPVVHRRVEQVGTEQARAEVLERLGLGHG